VRVGPKSVIELGAVQAVFRAYELSVLFEALTKHFLQCCQGCLSIPACSLYIICAQITTAVSHGRQLVGHARQVCAACRKVPHVTCVAWGVRQDLI
jgi:hypothetical protein